MNVITHTLLPTLLAVPLLPRANPREYGVSAGVVALGGALPDLLHPHLSLAARYASWSHTVFAFAGFSGVLLVLALLPRIRVPRVALVLASLAYALHLACDGISGGIVWLYPASAEVVGGRLVRYHWWWPIDAILVVVALGVFWWWPAYRRNRAAPVARRETFP